MSHIRKPDGRYLMTQLSS